MLVVSALIYYSGIYVPSEPEEGEVYYPYLLWSGPVVWVASLVITDLIRAEFHAILPTALSPSFWIVVVPGVCNMILGSCQWYFICAKVVPWLCGLLATDGRGTKTGAR